MIRRRDGNDFLLITQVSHARLSGQLAARVGNDRFAPLGPAVVRAIGLHDDGWHLHDDAPTVNPQGQPAHTFETPLNLALKMWTDSTDRAAAADPYAGLLVSLHGLGLSLHALKQEPGQPARHGTHEVFEVNKFQHRQVEVQETLRRRLGMRTDLPLRFGLAEPGRSPEEDALLFNFRMLQLLDRLSLDLCFGELRFKSVETIYPRPGQAAATLAVEKAPDGNYAVTPWPFDEPAITIPLPAKRIRARAYCDNQDLRQTLTCASEEAVDVSLRTKSEK